MKKALLAGFVVVFTGLLVFYLLGGFKPIRPKIMDLESRTLAGREVRGLYTSSEIEDAFELVRSSIEDSVLLPPLTIISFEPDTSNNKFVHYFIGASPAVEVIPEHLERREIEPIRVVAVMLNRHNLVMPRPQTINLALRDFADSNQFDYLDFTIEEYHSENDLRVYLPLSD